MRCFVIIFVLSILMMTLFGCGSPQEELDTTATSEIMNVQPQESLYPDVVPSLFGLDFDVIEPWTLTTLGGNLLVMEFNGDPAFWIYTGEKDAHPSFSDLFEVIASIVGPELSELWNETPIFIQEEHDPEIIGQLKVQKVIFQRGEESQIQDIIYLGEDESRFILLELKMLSESNSRWPIQGQGRAIV